MTATITVPCSMQVAGAMVAGNAELNPERLIWRPSNNDAGDDDGNRGGRGGGSALTGERSVPLTLVTGHQRNKPGAAKASLRLVLGGGGGGGIKPGAKPPAMVLQFAAETDRDVLSDQLKARLSDIERAKKILTSAGGEAGALGGGILGDAGVNRGGGGGEAVPAPVSAAELAARAALLQSNAELAELYTRLVTGGADRIASAGAGSTAAGRGYGESGDLGTCCVVTEEEFWAARQHLFKGAMAKTGATQKPGIANALDADLKGQRDGRTDTVTCSLTNEKMHRIFSGGGNESRVEGGGGKSAFLPIPTSGVSSLGNSTSMICRMCCDARARWSVAFGSTPSSTALTTFFFFLFSHEPRRQLCLLQSHALKEHRRLRRALSGGGQRQRGDLSLRQRRFRSSRHIPHLPILQPTTARDTRHYGTRERTFFDA